MKVAFSEILLIPGFRSGSIAQNENAKSTDSFRFSIKSGDFCQTERSDTILILEAYNEYHLDVFDTKQVSFQDPCVKHLQYSRKPLVPHILVSFPKLNNFTIDFSSNKVALVIFSWLEFTFLRSSADSETKRRNSRRSGEFCQTERSDTILALEA